MTRTKKITLRLLRDIISQKKVRGGIDSRTAATKVCLDLLASVRMSAGREWIRNRQRDDFVAEQRHVCANPKLGPGVRAEAAKRLCVLAGYSSPNILSNDPADEYTRLVAGPQASASTSEVKKFTVRNDGSKPVPANMLDFSGVGGINSK